MISRGFGLVAFFASVKASSVCIKFNKLNKIKRLPVDDENTSKHVGVLYEIDTNVNILCIVWYK
jgi:hypothetical protein